LDDENIDKIDNLNQMEIDGMQILYGFGPEYNGLNRWFDSTIQVNISKTDLIFWIYPKLRFISQFNINLFSNYGRYSPYILHCNINCFQLIFFNRVYFIMSSDFYLAKIRKKFSKKVNCI